MARGWCLSTHGRLAIQPELCSVPSSLLRILQASNAIRCGQGAGLPVGSRHHFTSRRSTLRSTTTQTLGASTGMRDEGHRPQSPGHEGPRLPWAISCAFRSTRGRFLVSGPSRGMVRRLRRQAHNLNPCLIARILGHHVPGSGLGSEGDRSAFFLSSSPCSLLCGYRYILGR